VAFHVDSKDAALRIRAAYLAGELSAQRIPDAERGDNAPCLYRSEYGPCAIGVVMPDDVIDSPNKTLADDHNHATFCALERAGLVDSDDGRWLNELQIQHDSWIKGCAGSVRTFVLVLNKKLPEDQQLPVPEITDATLD
jgi:hypothetical protein